jgi:hypothetical protein
MDTAITTLFENFSFLFGEITSLRNACHLGQMDTAITTLFEQTPSLLSEMVELRNAACL